METPPPTDTQLVDRARGGDTDAYGELVRRYQDRALATAFFILGDRQDAEDATQEAFTRAFAALGRFRPEGSFRPWLLRIVVNEAHDLRAAAQRRASLLARATGQLPSVGPAPSAEAASLSEQRRNALLRALFELREDDRLVITYRYFFDFSEAETAEVLGVARGTVKSRLARALARFGPIVRRLGPLVVVGPSVESALAHLLEELHLAPQLQARPELGNAVLQHVGVGVLSSGKGPSQLTRPASITLGALTAVGLVVGAIAFSARPPASPPMGTPAQAETQNSTLVPSAEPPSRRLDIFGADLNDSDRQEVAAVLGGPGTVPFELLSRAELAGTLTAHGLPVAAGDQAISSARLTCLGAGSGLTVRTRNVGLPAPAYAGALMVAGLTDASMIVAAPEQKPVTGEAALVGALRAAPVCLPDDGLDPNRVRLAYEELKAMQVLTGNVTDVTHASAIVATALHAVVTGVAQDAPAIEDALNVAAEREAVRIDDGVRAQLVSLLQELRGLDFGEYAQGYRIEQVGPDAVRVVPTPTN